MNRRSFLAAAGAGLAPGLSGRHYVYEFRGTPFEVGFQHGKALAQEIRKEADPSLAALARRQGGSAESALGRLLSRYEGLFRERLPAVLEEIRGIGEGAGLSYPYAFFAATRDLMRTGACTAFFCGRRQTRGGAVLMGQTKDTGAPLERYRIQRVAYSSGRRLIVLNYPGWIGNLCLSSDGVCFTGNSLYARPPEAPTAPGSFLKRVIMEKRSTLEVLEAIRGLRFENGCFLVADRTGHAVCLEMAAGRVDARDVSGLAFGHANGILSPPLKQYQTRSASPSSPARQKRIDSLLGAGAGDITVDYLERALADHEGFPHSVCRHFSEQDPATTTAAYVADLTNLRMRIAIGNPCAAPFQSYSMPL